MTTKQKLKPGFHSLKNREIHTYVSYFLVQGVYVYADDKIKPVKCWGTFTPDKKTFLGCSMTLLDAKEKVKTHKISKFMRK